MIKYSLFAAMIGSLLLAGCDEPSMADRAIHDALVMQAKPTVAEPAPAVESGSIELAQATPQAEQAAPQADEAPVAEKPVEFKLLDDPTGAKRLHETYRIWLDPAGKRVIVDGEVCFREGVLEMFACPKKTKEHESIVAVDSKAYLIHTALLALGVEPGSPVAFRPEYKPATGPEVDVTVQWMDANGKLHEARAQEWVRNVKTRKAMESPWVFAGSNFWIDDVTKQQHYMAEGGDLICVSNFPTAMLDLPIESSQSNDDLMFQAFTERIPPRGTKVRLILKPKIEKQVEGKIIDRGTSGAPK